MLDSIPGVSRKTLAAFAAVYLIWGSSYAAIRLSLESFPPFLLGGLRFGLAAVVLYAVLRARGHARPTARQWGAALVTGTLMFLCGSGMVGWAVQGVDTGRASALIATIPLWMVVLDWLLFGGRRPGLLQTLGLALGLGGVWLLVAPAGGVADLNPRALLLVGAAGCWATGSMLSRRLALPDSPLMVAAMQMLVGGGVLLLVGVSTGEIVQVRAPTMSSALAMVYLVIAGSLVGLCSYVYLLKTVRPAAAGTYAFVNPLIALCIGHLWLGEAVTRRMGFGAALVVLAVVLIAGRDLIRRRSPLRLVTPPARTPIENKSRSAA